MTNGEEMPPAQPGQAGDHEAREKLRLEALYKALVPDQITHDNVNKLDIDAIIQAGFMTDELREHIVRARRQPALENDLSKGYYYTSIVSFLVWLCCLVLGLIPFWRSYTFTDTTSGKNATAYQGLFSEGLVGPFQTAAMCLMSGSLVLSSCGVAMFFTECFCRSVREWVPMLHAVLTSMGGTLFIASCVLFAVEQFVNWDQFPADVALGNCFYPSIVVGFVQAVIGVVLLHYVLEIRRRREAEAAAAASLWLSPEWSDGRSRDEHDGTTGNASPVAQPQDALPHFRGGNNNSSSCRSDRGDGEQGTGNGDPGSVALPQDALQQFRDRSGYDKSNRGNGDGGNERNGDHHGTNGNVGLIAQPQDALQRFRANSRSSGLDEDEEGRGCSRSRFVEQQHQRDEALQRQQLEQYVHMQR